MGILTDPCFAVNACLHLHSRNLITGPTSSLGWSSPSNRPLQGHHWLRRAAVPAAPRGLLAATALAAGKAAGGTRSSRYGNEPSGGTRSSRYGNEPSGFRRPQRDRGLRDRLRGRNLGRREPRDQREAKELVAEFAGVMLRGPGAEWLLRQQQLSEGTFAPTKIQELALQAIYEGQSIALHSPTGTGKTVCMLLPMLERLQEIMRRSPRRGLRMLIIVHTGNLQLQLAGVAQTLLGPDRSQMVSVLRRDLGDTDEIAPITIATAKQLMELIDAEATSKKWLNALAWVDMVIVDEADYLLTAKEWKRVAMVENGQVLPCVEILDIIRKEQERARRRDPWQLVAASATMNRKTERRLRFATPNELTLIRAAGVPIVEGSRANMGQYSDGTTSLPPGLRHTVRVPEGDYDFSNLMPLVAATVFDLEASRTLVILCHTGRYGYFPGPMYKRNTIIGWLRSNMGEDGFEILNLNDLVQAAATKWDATPFQRSANLKQVVVGDLAAIRGMHVSGVDAVVIVGKPPSVLDYLHCAGRTARFEASVAAEDRGGAVVSVVPEDVANSLTNWGNFHGFKVLDVPQDAFHPRFDAHLVGGDLYPERRRAPAAAQGGYEDEADWEEDGPLAPSSEFSLEDAARKDDPGENEEDLVTFGAWN